MASDAPPPTADRRPRALAPALAGTGLLGALLLVVAEFTTLYTVHTSVYHSASPSVSAGSHNGYSLIPVALLAAALAAGPARERAPVRAALLVTGLVALAIALIGDLPDTNVSGLTPGLTLASSSAGPGLYLETLGAVMLVLAGGFGLLGTSRRP